MIKAKQLIVTAILVSLFSNLFGNHVYFEKINSDEGLPESSITAITQDSYGFMWFGSTNGLIRYNGYSFTVFRNVTQNTNKLVGNEVTALIELSDSTLLLGTNFNGVCEFDRQKEKFLVYQNDPNNNKSLSNNYILTIFEDSKKRVWIGTRGGLALFDRKTKTFTNFNSLTNNLAPNYVSGICEDKKGLLWLFCPVSTYFASFNPQTKEFKHYQYTKQLVKNINWGGGKIACDQNGILWIGSEFEGLFSFNPKTNVLQHESKLTKGAHSNDISSVLFLNDNPSNCYIAMDGGGLFMTNTKTKESYHFSTQNTSLNLMSDAILSIYRDKQKSLWIGMYAAGINIYKPSKQKFRSITASTNDNVRLPQKSVLSCAKKKDGTIILGTDGGGFVLYDPQTNCFKEIKGSKKSIPKVVKCILCASDGTNWIGTWGEGLYQFSADWQEINHFTVNNPDSTKRIHSTSVWSLAEDANGAIWIGTLTAGLSVYSPQKKQFIKQPEKEQKLIAGNSIFKIFCDSQHRVWVSNDTEGLYVYEKGDYNHPRIFFSKFNNEQIPNEIRDIYEDHDNTIWFATLNNGLYQLLDYKKGVFYQYSTKTILPTNAITQIAEGTNKTLWLGTNSGLISFNKKNKSVHVFDKEDGVQDDVFNVTASIKDDNGFIYCGGINGVNIFHPDSIVLNNKAPRVILTNLKIYDQVIEPGQTYGKRTYLQKPLYLTDTLVFTPNDNIFQIEFAALDFISPLKNRYKYKLEGFDKQWTSVSAQHRLATYTKLEPGTYIFTVKACNSDGVWNETGTSITIIILPAWWQTWWFRTLLIITIGSVVVLIYFIRTRRIRNLAFELEILVRERTTELQETNIILTQQNTKISEQNRQLENYTKEVTKQNEYILAQQSEIIQQKEILEKQTKALQDANQTKDKLFSIVAHDIKNPLGVLSGFVELLYTNYQKYDETKRMMFIQQINISAKSLSGLILNLLEWSRSQTKSIKTHIQQLSLIELVNETFDLVSEQASNKSISLTCIINPQQFVYGDKNMLETVLRNLITNALKFTPNEGSIIVRSSLHRVGKVCISISDSGIGMSKEQLNSLFVSSSSKSTKGTNNESGTGLGLIICKEFMELQNGSIEVESTEGQGTTFHLYMPDHMPANLKNVTEEQCQFTQNTYQIEKRDDVTVFPEIERFKNKSVLVVDDNDLLRQSVCDTLAEWFTVYQATQGNEAIERLKSTEIHVIISDLNMPICDGLELCSWVKQNDSFRHIPFMMHTAESDVRSQIESYRRGVNAYILKPVSKSVLVARVYALLFNEQ